EHVGAGGPGPGLGAGAALELHFVEQDLAELLGRAEIELAAGELVRLGLEGGGALGEIAREPGEDLPVDGDAAPFHAGENRGERALDGLVERGHVLGSKTRLEDAPEPEGHV